MPKVPNPAGAFADIETDGRKHNATVFDKAVARDAFVDLYNETVGHYLSCQQNEKGKDFWKEKLFRKFVFKYTRKILDEIKTEAPDPTAQDVTMIAREIMHKVHDEYCKHLPACGMQAQGKMWPFGPVCPGSANESAMA
jgi:hypothetical protein